MKTCVQGSMAFDILENFKPLLTLTFKILFYSLFWTKLKFSEVVNGFNPRICRVKILVYEEIQICTKNRTGIVLFQEEGSAETYSFTDDL